MSTFCGRLREVPGISIDRFDGDNVHSRAFFLSHCHSDHMQGLHLDFFQNLTTTDRFLYTSDVSHAILSRKFPSIPLNVKELPFVSPTMVHLDDGTVLVVVMISAGHCPGSVMFLFEGEERVLYTGDYRCGMKDFKKLKVFWDSFGEVEPIDSLYLDTTFLLKRYHSLPSRTESIRALIGLIKSAIANDQIVFLKTSAYYGYELCFKEVFNEFKMPVHVGQNSYDFYTSIPEMDECVTEDPSVTRIHSNCGGYKAICMPSQSQNIFTVTISVYSWTQSDLENGVLDYVDPFNVRLCYSTHASYEEGMEFLKFLQPKRVEVCVEPKEEADRVELERTIRRVLRQEAKYEGDIPEYFDYRKMNQRKKRDSQAATQFSDKNISKRGRDSFETTNQLGTKLKALNDTVSSLGINSLCDITSTTLVTTTLFNNQSIGSQDEHMSTLTNNTLITTLNDKSRDVLNQTDNTPSDTSCNARGACSVINTLFNNQSEGLQNEHLNPSTKKAFVTTTNETKYVNNSSRSDDLNQTNTAIPLQDTNTTCNMTTTSPISSMLFNKHSEATQVIMTDPSTDGNPIGSQEKVSRADRGTCSDDDYFRQELLNILGLETVSAKKDEIPERCPDRDLFSEIMSKGNTASEICNERDPVLEVLNLRISPCRETEDSGDSS